MDSAKTTVIATAPATPAAPAADQAVALAAKLLAEAGGATVVAKTVVKGWRTSEFWLTLGMAVTTHVLTLASAIPGIWGILASSAGVVAYNISRGMAKR